MTIGASVCLLRVALFLPISYLLRMSKMLVIIVPGLWLCDMLEEDHGTFVSLDDAVNLCWMPVAY